MRRISLLLVALAGFGTAALTGLAIGKSNTTLIVQKNTKDTMKSNKLQNVVATKGGLPLYLLTGDTKKHHECTKADGCFGVWKPYTVPKGTTPTKATGIKGKLSVLKRNGFSQVVLGKHPLYMYLGPPADTKGVANGDGIMSFGGTWHLIPDPASGGSGTTTTMSTNTTTSTYTYPTYP